MTKVSCSVPGLTLLFSDPSQAIRKQQKRIAPEQDPPLLGEQLSQRWDSRGNPLILLQHSNCHELWGRFIGGKNNSA